MMGLAKKQKTEACWITKCWARFYKISIQGKITSGMPENLQKLNQVIRIDEDVWWGSEVWSMPKKPSAEADFHSRCRRWKSDGDENKEMTGFRIENEFSRFRFSANH